MSATKDWLIEQLENGWNYYDYSLNDKKIYEYYVDVKFDLSNRVYTYISPHGKKYRIGEKYKISTPYGIENITVVNETYKNELKTDYNYKVFSPIEENVPTDDKYYNEVNLIADEIMKMQIPISTRVIPSEYTELLEEARKYRIKGFYIESLCIYKHVVKELMFFTPEINLYIAKILLGIGAISKAYTMACLTYSMEIKSGLKNPFSSSKSQQLLDDIRLCLEEFHLDNKLDKIIKLIQDTTGYDVREMILSKRILKWEMIQTCIAFNKIRMLGV